MTLLSSLLIILAIILFGIACEKRKIFTAAQIEGFEVFLLKVALPCYLFTVTLHYSLSSLFHPAYIYSYLLSFLAISLLTMSYFWKNHAPALCIKILTSGYANTAIYTLPIITLLLGDPRAAILSNLLQVLVIQSIFITILGFVSHHEKSLRQRLFSSFSNPLVLMPLMGLALNYLQLSPPIVLTQATKILGESAASMALFTFGLSLSSIKITKAALINKDLLLIVLSKNVLHPLFAFFIGCVLFHLDHYWLYSLLIATSAPTAFVIYLIAKQFSVEQQFVKLAVASSSILSLFSLVFIILVN